MKRGTLFLMLFILISLAIVGISQYLRGQEPVQITLAVDPLAQPWITALARDFNAQNITFNGTRRVEVLVTPGNLTVIDDIDVWQATQWTEGTPPNIWIPATSFAVDFATSGAGSLPFAILEPSVARTPLMFVGYADRVEALSNLDDTPGLSWHDIAQAAELQSWREIDRDNASASGFFTIAFLDPANNAEGLAALYAAAADLAETNELSDNDVRGAFCDQFAQIVDRVPNFNTIGDDVAGYMVQRGRSAADIGIAPESRWLSTVERINRNAPVTAAYLPVPFVFDFPVVLWNDASTSDQTRNAARTFAEWLLEPEQQARLAEFGLRPVVGSPSATSELFEAAAEYGFMIDAPLENPVQPPSRSATLSMLQCVGVG